MFSNPLEGGGAILFDVICESPSVKRHKTAPAGPNKHKLSVQKTAYTYYYFWTGKLPWQLGADRREDPVMDRHLVIYQYISNPQVGLNFEQVVEVVTID